MEIHGLAGREECPPDSGSITARLDGIPELVTLVLRGSAPPRETCLDARDRGGAAPS